MRSKKVRFFLPLSRYEIEILISPIQKILQTLNITYSLFSGIPVHWPPVAEPRVWVRGECGQWSGPHHPPAQAVHWPRAAPQPRLPDRHSDPALLLQHGRQLLLEPPVRGEQREQHGRGEQDIQLEWDISVRGALLHCYIITSNTFWFIQLHLKENSFRNHLEARIMKWVRLYLYFNI